MKSAVFWNREIVTFASSCTCILGDNKGWKRRKKSFAKARRNIRNRNMVQGRQPPPETWPDTALVSVLFSPCCTAFLAPLQSSTFILHNQQPVPGADFAVKPVSLSRNRGPHTREKRISWLGTKRDVDESSKARSFIPHLSLEISGKNIYFQYKGNKYRFLF